jgi:hypothetical protein
VAQSTLFPYTPVPNSLKRLLEKIPSVGTPTKADQKWLASLGFGGGNNQMSLGVLRKVGVIDQQGKPTELYKALRAKDRAKWAQGIKRHYSDLYSTYADAHRKDDEALVAFVRSKTDYGDTAQRLAVRTFKVLAGFGDYDAAATDDSRHEPGESDKEEEGGSGERAQRKEQRRAVTGAGVALTVNIQLQLPASADGEVYDKLFAAMAKHLKGLATLE